MKLFSIKLFLAFLIISTNACSAWTPNKPITVIFGNSPGSGNEIAFRIIQPYIEKNYNVNFIFQHRPGASELVGMNYFSDTEPNGYTIAVAGCQDTFVVPEIWYPTITKFNALEFSFITNLGRSPLAFWANPASNVKTPNDLVKKLRNTKEPLKFAVGGAGHRLAIQYLVESLQVNSSNIETIMYKSPRDALVDVVGGHIEFAVTPVTVGHPHLTNNKLRLIGITNDYIVKHLENYPLMKTIAPGLNIHGCWNIILPKNTNTAIVDWYKNVFVSAILNKESQDKFSDLFIFTTHQELDPNGVKNSMIKLRQVWQPIAKNIRLE